MEDSFDVSVDDSEIDMKRGRLLLTPVGLIKRVFNSLQSLRAGRTAFGTPRRSIDQKTQEYWPLYEE
jgi:hypothetical protein